MKYFILVAALTAFASPALAGSCPLQMKAIDAALASGPSVSPDALVRVKELRAQGAQQHKSGQHGASIQSLQEAKAILGIK